MLQKILDFSDPITNFFHTKVCAYFRYLANFEGHKIDLSQKFIYVPINKKPEISKSEQVEMDTWIIHL